MLTPEDYPDWIVEECATKLSRSGFDGCECDGYIAPCVDPPCRCREAARAVLERIIESGCKIIGPEATEGMQFCMMCEFPYKLSYNSAAATFRRAFDAAPHFPPERPEI